MHILQLANGYLGNQLYKNLFSVQEKMDIQNTVYVPIRNGHDIPTNEPDNVIISPCFSQLDRILFFRKQQRILKDLEKLNLSQCDLIHAHTVFSGGYSALQLHKRYGLPYLVAVRNTDVNVFFKYMVHLRKLGVDIMRNAEKIVFLSSVYQEKVLQTYIPVKYREVIKEKSVVIPNGIAPLFLNNKAENKSLSKNGVVRLIYVGEVSANKNLEETIQAAELLRKQGTEVTLTAVGKITDDKYTSLIKETPFLTHYDRCPQEEVIKHLRGADIFVMPSHTETFGLVYAEAMSQGLPVLYTRGQGFDGHFPDGTVGYAVSDTDPKELAEKILQVVSHYDELSTNCIQLVDKFTWESIAEQYSEIYLSTAKHK